MPTNNQPSGQGHRMLGGHPIINGLLHLANVCRVSETAFATNRFTKPSIPSSKTTYSAKIFLNWFIRNSPARRCQFASTDRLPILASPPLLIHYSDLALCY